MGIAIPGKTVFLIETAPCVKLKSIDGIQKQKMLLFSLSNTFRIGLVYYWHYMGVIDKILKSYYRFNIYVSHLVMELKEYKICSSWSLSNAFRIRLCVIDVIYWIHYRLVMRTLNIYILHLFMSFPICICIDKNAVWHIIVPWVNRKQN